MEVNKKGRGRKTGFTLVELLAVIVILAIILVIAVPKVMSVIEDAKKATLESTAKMIASQAEKQKVQNTVLGNDKAITCKDITNINDEDYASCEITFEDNTAKVTITGGGKFEGLYVCGGTKTDAEATKDSCGTTAGNNSGAPVLNCTYDGELVYGAEFVHNQYTYRYQQEVDSYDDYLEPYTKWRYIEDDGWGVKLTDPDSTEPVNTPICTYINDKPVLSISGMFLRKECYIDDLDNECQYLLTFANAESIDVSSWNTSTVTRMGYTFYESKLTTLDLSSFDTSNVYHMQGMFSGSAVTELDLSSFDTSNVIEMQNMFFGTAAKTIYVGDNWNTSNVIYDNAVFRNARNLVGGNGTTYNSSYIDKTYARVDKEGEPGYFTYKASN